MPLRVRNNIAMLPDKYQQKAISEIDKDVYVSASAGTGKTAVLTNRFINILKEKRLELSAIVAITFTEKAASEMKSRIFALVNEQLSLAKGKAEEYSYWKKIKKEFIYANISTIHSFCSSIIRENAYELKIDPDFDIIEENHIKYELSKWIKGQFIKWQDEEEGDNKEILNSLLQEYKLNELIDILNKLFINYHNTNSFIIPLYEEKLTRDSDYHLFLSDSIEKEKENTFKRFMSSFLYSRDGTKYEDWYNLKVGLEDHKQTKKEIERVETLDKAISNLYKKDLSYKDISYSLVKPIYDDFFTKSLQKDDAKISPDLKEIYKDISDFLLTLRWKLPEYLFGIDNLDSKEVSKTYRIIRHIIHIYKSLYQSIIASPIIVPILYKWLSAYLLTFDDLQSYALRLLKNNSYSSEELKNKIQYIMVDEVQDIDEIQGAIISALSSNRVNTFIVGDEKQSIYKFRGANISSFRRLGDKIAKPIELEFSYRSARGIIDFANLLFTDLMDEPYESFEASYKGLKAKDTATDIEPKVELVLYDKANREIEAKYIGNRIIDLVEEDKKQYGDIAILFRTFTDIEVYESVFRSKGIPYSTIKTKGFYDNKEIVDCLSLLKYIEDASDEIALCAILRSPFCGISDETLFCLSSNDKGGRQTLIKGFYNFRKNTLLPEEEHSKLAAFLELLTKLKDKKDRVRVDELLKSAIDESLYVPGIIAKARGVEIKDNLDMLITKIKNIQGMLNTHYLSEILAFIENIEKYNDTSSNVEKLSSENKVIIMSIHKSKGMEFPIVIIPNSGKRQSNKDSIILDNEYGIALKSLVNNSNEEYKLRRSFLLEYLVNKDKRKDIAESKRLLYVAVTRAKEYLIILGEAFLFPKAPFDLRETATWMDYILWVLFNRNNAIRELLIDKLGLEEPFKKTFLLSNTKIMLLYKCLEDDKASSISDIRLVEEPIVNINDKLLLAMDKVSASSLLVYTKCLRKFYYKFLLQIEESGEELGPYKGSDIGDDIKDDIKENEWSLSKDIPLNLIGSLVHKILESYGGSKPVLDIVLNYLKLERLSIFADDRSLEEVSIKLKQILNTFVNSRLYNEIEWSEKNASEYDHNELAFSCLLGDILLEGSIDKIYKNRSGDICVLDYKTNRFNKGSSIARQIRSKNALYQMQMEIYWFIVQLLFPNEGTILKSSLYYFDIDKVEDILVKPSLFAASIEEDILSVIESIKVNLSLAKFPLDVFHTRNASKQDCLFCGYFMCENKV